MNQNEPVDYSDDELERFVKYKNSPLTNKLQYLDETKEYFDQITPKKAKEAWKKLVEEGF